MSNEIQDYVFKRLSLVADCNQEHGNQVAILSSALNDLNALYELTGKRNIWHNYLQAALTATNHDKETIERFRHQLISFTKFEVNKLIVTPSLKVNKDRIKYLYTIRALIILWHLENNKKISSYLLNQLEVVFKAKKAEELLNCTQN